MEKVTSVQQALAAGTYHVSARDIADSLMAAMISKS
jgi:anti-sigma28 factor (negative regulator of flagellin synthesis)